MTLVILPRILKGVGISHYGDWATLAAVLAIGQLAQTGTGTEIGRRVAAAHGTNDRAALRQAVWQGVTVLCGIAVVMEVLGLLLARPLVALVFSTVAAGERGQLTLLFIGIVSLFSVGLVGNGYFAVLGGLQRGDYANWSMVASYITGAAATVAGLAAGLGLWAIFLADCVQLVVAWLGPAIGARRVARDVAFRLTRVPWGVTLGFIGMPAMLIAGSASDVFDSQVDKLVLTHTVGPVSSAMFQIGVALELSLKSVAFVPLAVMLAGTAELYRSNPLRLRRLEALAGSATQSLGALAAGGLVLFSHAFLQAWLGPGYGQAARAGAVLAVAALLNIWTAPWTYYAMGRGRYYYVLLAATVTLAVNFAATVVLTSTIGLNGALIGSVAGSATGLITARAIVYRWEKRPWLLPALRASLPAGAVVGVFALAKGRFPSSWPGLFGWACAYTLVCGLALLMAGATPVTVTFRGPFHPALAWRQADGA
jgi:O-antigen/teichoic acid export membrane protein